MGNCIDNTHRYPRQPQNDSNNRRPPRPNPLQMQLAPNYNFPPNIPPPNHNPIFVSFEEDGPELI